MIAASRRPARKTNADDITPELKIQNFNLF